MTVSERIEELKSFNVDRMSSEEMIFLESDAQRLRSAYETRAIPAPEWVVETIRTLNLEIDRRKHDDLMKRKKELLAANAADMSASERREARKAELERIERELAAAVAPAGTTA